MKMPQTASKTYITQTRRIFYCDIKIKIPASFSELILEEGFALLEYIDSAYNSYQPNSYFSGINNNAGSWVNTDSNVIFMMQNILYISAITNGAYDITAMPLLKLWGFYKSNTTDVPSLTQIADALEDVDYKKIAIDDLRVKIDKGQEIISGSFIKAFAVDMLVNHLKERGVGDAIINAGGSTIYAVSNQDSNWNVSIPHPFITDKKSGSVAISNNCFSLSAASHNYVAIQDKKYSHIINAKTGLPSKNVQVGVVCKSAFLSDVISTALFTVTDEDFEPTVKKLKQFYDLEAFLVTPDGAIKTTGYNLFNTMRL